MYKIKDALGRRVVVKAIKDPVKSKTGQIIGENKEKKATIGEVISIGPEVVDANLEIGSIVSFSGYGGQSFDSQGVEYILLNYAELNCTLQKVDTNEKA